MSKGGPTIVHASALVANPTLPPEKVYIVFSDEKSSKLIGIFTSLPKIVQTVGSATTFSFAKNKNNLIRIVTHKGKAFLIRETKVNIRI